MDFYFILVLTVNGCGCDDESRTRRSVQALDAGVPVTQLGSVPLGTWTTELVTYAVDHALLSATCSRITTHEPHHEQS
jgi:hypothetical protein